MIIRFKQFLEYIRTHERESSLIAILLGFIWDTLTLGRADQLFGNIVFITYLSLSALIIFSLSVYKKRNKEVPSLLSPLIHFAYGNLAGGLFVVYGQSGVLGGNIVFFVLLGLFILGNEIARNYSSRFNFYVISWYFLLFSYLAIAIPVILDNLGTYIFLLSGIVSLIVISLFLYLLNIVSKREDLFDKRKTIFPILAVFVILNGLYFGNFIPPVPLALTEIGIYHSIDKLPNGNYSTKYEKPIWNEFFRSTAKQFNIMGNNGAYCFSSVFAPVRLSTNVYHHWEYYDMDIETWVSKTVVSFPITGGREAGYRAYSMKNDLTLGDWRCSVETVSGALIGRTEFEVVNGIPVINSKIF